MKNFFSPLVSIIIPVYNGSNYIKKAIDSALNQTYKNIEILVINDGSTDNGETEKMVLSYGDKLRYFRKENGGVSSALNYGIKMMKGDFFSWLSHDDEYMPFKIERQIELISKCSFSKDLIAVCNDCIIDKESNIIRKYRCKNTVKILDYKKMLYSVIGKKGLNGCALLIPKDLFIKVGLFNEHLRYIQDFEMWTRICLAEYNFILDDTICVRNRLHSQQVTQNKQDLYYLETKDNSFAFIKNIYESSLDNNYIYLYVKSCAIHNCGEAVKICVEICKDNKILSKWQLIKLQFYKYIGKFRNKLKEYIYKRLRIR